MKLNIQSIAWGVGCLIGWLGLGPVCDWIGRRAEALEYRLLPPPLDVTAHIQTSGYHVVADQVSISRYDRQYNTVRARAVMGWVLFAGVALSAYLILTVIHPRELADLYAELSAKDKQIAQLERQLATVQQDRDAALGKVRHARRRVVGLEMTRTDLEDTRDVLLDRLDVLREEADRKEAMARAAYREAVYHRVLEDAGGRVDAGEVTDILFREARRHGVPTSYLGDFTDAILDTAWVESHWRPGVVSSAGAQGVMQVLPTYHQLPGVERCGGRGLAQNICAGVRVWMYYLGQCGGNRVCTHARYNGAYEYSVSANQYLTKIAEAGR